MTACEHMNTTAPALIGRTILVTPHVHISAVHGIAVIALIVAVFGTAHLIALTHDNRASRAFVSLGF